MTSAVARISSSPPLASGYPAGYDEPRLIEEHQRLLKGYHNNFANSSDTKLTESLKYTWTFGVFLVNLALDVYHVQYTIEWYDEPRLIENREFGPNYVINLNSSEVLSCLMPHVV